MFIHDPPNEEPFILDGRVSCQKGGVAVLRPIRVAKSIPWGQNCQTQVIKRNENISKAFNALFPPTHRFTGRFTFNSKGIGFSMLAYTACQHKTVGAYLSGRDVFVSASTGLAGKA